MELSVMSPVLNQMEMEDALSYLSNLGVDSLEIGAGGYPGKVHLNPQEYMAYPEMFAAIAPCCGGGMPWNAHTLTMPVWAFHGEKDEVVWSYESYNMVEAMKKARLDAKLTIFPECGHNSWELAYSEELLEWLLMKKRKG